VPQPIALFAKAGLETVDLEGPAG